MMCYSNNGNNNNAAPSRRRSSLLLELLAMESFQDLISNDSEDPNLIPQSQGNEKRNRVKHNYHDHSCDKDDGPVRHPAKGGVTVPFPLKLYDMLDEVHSDPELASIVNWQPHGRCFVVRKQKEFAEQVLPRFFQQKKYASFQRQLNLYGFSRITRGPDRGSYYHECLLRGKRFLSYKIQRRKIKGTGGRLASNPSEEPNFYTMAYLPDPHVRNLTPLPLVAPVPDESTSTSNAFVFGDMPFYPTESKKDFRRRHSLEEPRMPPRRSSLIWEPFSSEQQQQQQQQGRKQKKRSSLIFDESFMIQLEKISSMSKSIENDQDLGMVVAEKILL